MNKNIGEFVLNCVDTVDKLITNEMRNDDNFIYAESISKIIRYEKNYSVRYLQMRRESLIRKRVNVNDLKNKELVYALCREFYSRYKLLLNYIGDDTEKFFVKNGNLYYQYTIVNDHELEIEVAMEYSIIALKTKQKVNMYGLTCVI